MPTKDDIDRLREEYNYNLILREKRRRDLILSSIICLIGAVLIIITIFIR